jgi:hypothetical protein
MDFLLLVVIFFKFLKILNYFMSLNLDLFIDGFFKPFISYDYIPSFDWYKILYFPQKIVVLKLCPELLAPFCKYSQNWRMFYDNLHIFYLSLIIFGHIFRNLSANLVRSIVLDIIPISVLFQRGKGFRMLHNPSLTVIHPGFALKVGKDLMHLFIELIVGSIRCRRRASSLYAFINALH